MAAYLLRAEVGATAHGFRSSFNDWERHEGVVELLLEFALAHVGGSRTVAAHARDDLLEKRRPVMQASCEFVNRSRCRGAQSKPAGSPTATAPVGRTTGWACPRLVQTPGAVPL